ncbi:MAG: HsdM family class I SAM-dependent methyltransferase [Promethearchaeota archaeon]
MVTDRTVPQHKRTSFGASDTSEIKSMPRGFSRNEFLKLYHSTLGQIRQEFSLIFISNPGLLSSSEPIQNYIKKETTLTTKDPEFFTKLGYEAAYLLLNKIVTYTLVQHYVHQAYGIKIDVLYDLESHVKIKDQLSTKFRDVTHIFELGPIFQQTPFLNGLPFTEQLQSVLIDFILPLNQIKFDGSALSSLGNIFQEIIPIAEQKRLGQIYTPPEIASFMAKLAVQSPSDVILDPACGCGSLLLESYSILQGLPHPFSSSSYSLGKLHKSMIEQLWGVEIGLFPAHIAMLSLAFKDLSSITTTVGILMEDFLEIGPLKKYFVKSKNLQSGEPIVREMPSRFDVILANPPYIKQEKIPNKKVMIKNLPIYAAYRSHISLPTHPTRPTSDQKSKSKNKTPKVKLGLTGKTDYYGYFLWYSTYFLKEGGRLCFIVPNKWLDVKYGEKIKEFLLQKFQLRAIIGFEKNVFPNAQVSTVILVADKCQAPDLRANTKTQFLLLQKSPNISQIQNWINSNPSNTDASLKSSPDGSSPSGSLYEFFNDIPGIKRTEITQRNLNPQEKWSIKYIYQSQFSQIVDSCQLISLDNGVISRVLGGIKTGANDFYFPSSEKINQFGIPSKYLKPGIRSGRSIPKSFIVDKDVNPFLSIPANYIKGTNPNLDEYIQHGKEVEGYPKRPSVIWKPWYRIPESNQDSPDILFLRHIDRSFRAHWNQIHAIVADGVRGITVLDDKWHLFLLGVCNSTFFYWQAHLRGRWEGQGDLQLLVYELRQFRIPDPRTTSSQVISRVESAMKTILTASASIHDVEKGDQETLDRAVLATMNLESTYGLLISETSTLESRRLKKARK